MSKSKDRTFSIYKITNLVNGKCYVGQSVNPSSRKARHFGTRCDNRHLKASIRKYTETMFNWEILEDGLTQEQVDEREKYWIAHFDSMDPNGYNIMAGGQQSRLVGKRSPRKGKKGPPSPRKGISWGSHTEEAKQKIRDASIKKARLVTEEQVLLRVKKALNTKQNNPNFDGLGPAPSWKGKELPHKEALICGIRRTTKQKKLKELGIDFDLPGSWTFNLKYDSRKERLKKELYEIKGDNDFIIIEEADHKPLIVMDLDKFVELYKERPDSQKEK